MLKTITAVYTKGVFKPIQKIQLQENQRVRLKIMPENEVDLIESQKEALLKLAGIGSSGLKDISQKHDEYLYQKDW